VHRERERVDGQVARTEGAGNFRAPAGRLFRPEHLAHGIAGNRPDELLFLRLIRVPLDGFQNFVRHLGAVLMAHVAGQLRVADVEMRFIDDDISLSAGLTVVDAAGETAPETDGDARRMKSTSSWHWNQPGHIS
jgi:hypothetical protein